jgi:alcohol oxidase
MIPTEVDIIVAGGGPAGCAVAGRLARADPNLQVCLVEAGASNYEGSSSFSASLLPLLDADPASHPPLKTPGSTVPESTSRCVSFAFFRRRDEADLSPFSLPPALFATQNMQRIPENNKATFYEDTMQSSYLRGRKSLVPFVVVSLYFLTFLTDLSVLTAAPTFSAEEAPSTS